jgi:hypothetical protein
MKITLLQNGAKIRLSDHELEIFKQAIQGFSPLVLHDTGLRRSWSRRTSGGPFMRIDENRRTD